MNAPALRPWFARLARFAMAWLAWATATAQEPMAEGVPAFNDLFARTIIIETLPLVEKHTGWKIPELPKFRLVTREQYAAVSAREVVDQIRRQMPEMTEANALATAEEAARSHAVGLLGRYSFLSRTIFLLPGNLPPMAKRMKIEHRFTRDLIEIIVAHEMTHVAQDCAHPYVRFQAEAHDEEAQAAYAMLAEGHAMFIQERVAADLRVNEAAARLAERMVADSTRGQSGWGRYLAGKKFVEAAYARGGLRLVQQLFTKPPRTRSQVLSPETYFLPEGRELVAPGDGDVTSAASSPSR